MIRIAEKEDIPQIMEIIKQTVEEMKSYNNTQWDENYPQAIHFENDINLKQLYVYDDCGKIGGFICAGFTEPAEYKTVKWISDEKCMVFRRMAINLAYRNKGIATSLIKFAENLAVENNIKYIKTNTSSLNFKMNSLFLKLGYIYRGNMNFMGKDFLFRCYDKKL